jgi:hypothetical protein
MASQKPSKIAWCSSCGYSPPYMNPNKNDARSYVALHMHYSGICPETGEAAKVEPDA